jgi:hypothetical protein
VCFFVTYCAALLFWLELVTHSPLSINNAYTDAHRGRPNGKKINRVRGGVAFRFPVSPSRVFMSVTLCTNNNSVLSRRYGENVLLSRRAGRARPSLMDGAALCGRSIHIELFELERFRFRAGYRSYPLERSSLL